MDGEKQNNLFGTFAFFSYLCTINLKTERIMDLLSWIIIAVMLLGFSIAFFCLYRYYLRRLKREVRRAQKSEQLKSVFIDNACHTLRAPLNAIVGYSNLILEEKDENMQPAEVKKLASSINNDCQQLIAFVGHLFELSKFEGITPSFTFIEVNLTELMASYRREVLTSTKPDVSVHVRTDLSPHCKATLDTNFMHQLMMHLLMNAARHATQGDIVIRYGFERRGIKVSISYMGIGQAELIGADIYSYLQAEDALANVKESSALGLAMCRFIIDVLGGEISMDTENDKKTVTTFWFPCKMVDMYREL